MPDGKKQHPFCLTFNLDMSSCGMREQVTAVFVSPRVHEWLKQQERSVACTEKQVANRFVHYVPLISAEGRLPVKVILLYDRSFTSATMTLVQLLPYLFINLLSWTSARAFIFGRPRRARHPSALLLSSSSVTSSFLR